MKYKIKIQIQKYTLQRLIFLIFFEVFVNLGVNIIFYNKINFYYFYKIAKNLIKYLIDKLKTKNKYNIQENKKHIILIFHSQYINH